MHDTSAHMGALSADETQTESHLIAASIYQDSVDLIGRHFWDRNWDALREHIAVPNKMTCFDAERVIETLDEWISLARATRKLYADMRVTEYHRICRSARFSDAEETRIEGTHITYIMSGSILVTPPHRGSMTLVLSDGRWRSNGLHTEQRETLLPTIHADRIKYLKHG